jgi:hypothetical protein
MVSEARQQQATQMRLNQAGPTGQSRGPASNADLVVHQDDLGAVGNEAFRLHSELQAEGRTANGRVARRRPAYAPARREGPPSSRRTTCC